jgi:hypothetical protein
LGFVINEAVTHQQKPTDPTSDQDLLSSPEAIKQFAGYFELLSKIDQRLKKEDPEYRAKHYPNEL